MYDIFHIHRKLFLLLVEITLLTILFFAFGYFRNLLGTQIQAQLFQTN